MLGYFHPRVAPKPLALLVALVLHAVGSVVVAETELRQRHGRAHLSLRVEPATYRRGPRIAVALSRGPRGEGSPSTSRRRLRASRGSHERGTAPSPRRPRGSRPRGRASPSAGAPCPRNPFSVPDRCAGRRDPYFAPCHSSSGRRSSGCTEPARTRGRSHVRDSSHDWTRQRRTMSDMVSDEATSLSSSGFGLGPHISINTRS